MTSREIVKKTIRFKQPERLPYLVYVDIERFEEERKKEEVEVVRKLMNEATTDFITMDILPDPEWKSIKRPPFLHSIGYYTHEEREDEWQVIWKELRVIDYPLEADWSLLDTYVLPNPHCPGRFQEAEDLMKENEDKYHLGLVWFTLFERLWMLRGFTNMMVDPYIHQAEFIRLRDVVMEFNIGLIDEWLALGVDGIFISDDWGGQKSLLISPDDWRKFYMPSYKKMFDRIHAGGADVWMHSCGNVAELIPDLIDIGLDVLNPIQPRSMDIDYLSKTYSGKLCFHGGADVQETIPHGTPGEIRREVEHLVSVLGKDNGGYIGGTSHTILPDTPLENIEALYSAFNQFCGGPRFGFE